MKKAIFNWSGGKDSTLALHKVIHEKRFDITCLLTSVSEQYQRVSQHGVRAELLEKQAASLGFDLKKLILPESPSMETYNKMMYEMMTGFKDSGIDTAVFGDIFLEDLRKYREDKLIEVGFKADFPLWKIPTPDLAREFIDLGYKAVIVCVDNRHLDKEFAGRELDHDFLKDLPKTVDPCGENGEYHSFVYDGPIFKKKVIFERGEVVYRTYKVPASINNATCGTSDIIEREPGFWFCDLLPIL